MTLSSAEGRFSFLAILYRDKVISPTQLSKSTVACEDLASFQSIA